MIFCRFIPLVLFFLSGVIVWVAWYYVYTFIIKDRKVQMVMSHRITLSLIESPSTSFQT